MNIKPLISPLLGIYKSWYNRLNNKERRLFFIFASVLAVSFYFNLFLKPTLDDIMKLKKQEQGYQDQLAMLQSQFPSAAKARQDVEAKKDNLKNLKLKISDTESKLISASGEERLLAEAIKLSQSLTIDLGAVKETIKEEREGFARLYIDLQFTSNYRKALTYIRGLESVSPFVKIEEMALSESKNEPLSTVDVSLRLSALLNYGTDNQAQLTLSGKDVAAGIGELKRSPFTPKFITEKTKRKNLKVTGITYRDNEAGSTAIINGKIVRVGDQIEDVKIERISYRCVIVDNGVGKETLQLER